MKSSPVNRNPMEQDDILNDPLDVPKPALASISPDKIKKAKQIDF